VHYQNNDTYKFVLNNGDSFISGHSYKSGIQQLPRLTQRFDAFAKQLGVFG
jgi:hypothetical protein